MTEDAAGMILVVNMTPDRKRRHWLRPKLYLLATSSGEQAWLSPWPFGMKWAPATGDPDYACTRCGADQTGKGGNSGHAGGDHGFLCFGCHDLTCAGLPPQVSRAQRLWWRWEWRVWGRWRFQERADILYLRWCRRFGTQVVQQEPPVPDTGTG
jgi:hypothetical protein